MKVVKIESGLAVVLSPDVIDRLGLKEGDEFALVGADDDGMTIRAIRDEDAAARRAEDIASLEKIHADLKAAGLLLPADYKFSRDDCYPARRGGTGD